MTFQNDRRILSRIFAPGLLALSLAVSTPLLAQNLTLSSNAQAALALAEELYPALFGGGATDPAIYEGYTYKYFHASGIYVGFKDGKVFLLGGQAYPEITDVGTEAEVLTLLQTEKANLTNTDTTATVTTALVLSAAGGRGESQGIFTAVGNGYLGLYTDVNHLKAALFTADDVRGTTIDLIPSESGAISPPSNHATDIVTLADGSGYIVALQSMGNKFGTANQAYRFLQLDASGNAVGTPQEIVRSADTQASSIRVEQLTDGGLAFVWSEAPFIPNVGGDFRIGARLYNADLTPRTDKLTLIDRTGDLTFTDIAATANGGFIVGFVDRSTTPAGDLSLMAFTATGAESGAQKKGIDTGSMDSFAKLSNGNYAIAQVTSVGGFGSSKSNLSIQIVNGEGLPVVAESIYESLTVPSAGGNQNGTPIIAPLPEGGFFLVWSYTPPRGPSPFAPQEGDIHAQQFSATGVAVGSKIIVDAGTVGLQQLHKVSVIGNKRIAVSWNNATPSPVEYDALYAILTYK